MVGKKHKLSILQTLEDIKGDKIVLMILMFLIGISMLSISSSTSMLAMHDNISRLEIIKNQVFTICIGLVITFVVYLAFKVKWIKTLSKLGFPISLAMLLIIIFKIRLGGFISASEINESDRIIKLFGFNLHVVEVMKLAMIMYTAWAISAYHDKSLELGNRFHRLIAEFKPKWGKRLTADLLNQWIYIYIPLVVIGVITSGISLYTAILIVGICGVMVVIGKVLKFKHIVHFVLIAAAMGALVITVNKATDGKAFSHLQSSLNRMDIRYEKNLEEAYGTDDFQKVLDRVRQPISAKIAIKEGGVLFGKGPGNSTQKYVVPIIYEDYMFAFIVEEYGLFGALVILSLYSSLLARGNIIVRNIKEEFGKMAVVGVVFLISGQAIFHILVNVGLFPISGQTLPMVSHGRFSFWMFSAAFGILLNMSKLGKENIEKETIQSAPIIEKKEETSDDVKSSMDALDDIDFQ